MIERGAVHWADVGDPVGSRPAKRRPVVVVQSDAYNESRIATVVVAVMTTNTALATQPGNVFVPALASGLKHDSVVNVTQFMTLDKVDLDRATGQVPESLMREVDAGLRRVLAL